MNKPLVSIIIAAYNEQDTIAVNLKSLKDQTYSQCEVIVVDDNSTDKTYEVASKFTHKVYKRPHAERSIQRNYGASKAKGQYLLFLDADMELESDVVGSCVKLITTKSNIGAVAIPEKSVSHTFWEKVKAYERSFYNAAGDKDTDAPRFFPKKVFQSLGGYDEAITGPEDWDLPERIVKSGLEVDRVNSYILHHERISSLLKLATKKYYYALSAHKYLAKHSLSAVGPKTVYFLRPVFYRQWTRLISHPFLTLAMIWMLTVEMMFGLTGYIVGRFRL